MATITRAVPNPRLIGLLNPLIAFAVRRGVGRVADRLTVLHWRGHRSGRPFSTPITKYEVDGQLFVKTRAGYKHNFVDGHPCELVLEGERRPFIGTTVDAPAAVAARLRAVLDQQGLHAGAKALSLSIDGDPTIDELTAFVADDGLVLISFEPS